MTEFAEEILGMPVRIGFPTGVKGITQLVHGPQYATGVGLVKYGAQAMADAAAREASPIVHARLQQQAKKEVAQEIARDKSRFWEWIKQAF